MKKGGYKIIDFKGTSLSSTATEISGIFNQIVDDYDKPVMVSGVSISEKLMDDAYAGVKEKTVGSSKVVELTVYGGIITVTEDDEVTFAVSKSLEELTAEIGDLDDLETTEKDTIVGAINEVNNTLNDMLIIRQHTSTDVRITANGALLLDANTMGVTSIEGYSPVAAVMVTTGNNNVLFRGFNCYATGTQVMLMLVNTSNSDVTFTPNVLILYAKKSVVGN